MKKTATKLSLLESLISRIKFRIIAARKVYGIGSSVALMILLLPYIVVFFFCTFLLLSSTRLTVLSMIIENPQVVGLLTSAFLIVGGILGLRLVLQIMKYKKGPLMFWFYLIFSIGLLFIGMQEVRWGQQFFISEVSSNLSKINQSEETIFHSFKFWRNYLEIFPLAFGLAGLLGIWISKKPHFREISVPRILWSWFVIIAIISAIDLSHDFYDPPTQFDNLVNNLEEVIEMMVGITGFLFIWLNTRRLRFGEREIV